MNLLSSNHRYQIVNEGSKSLLLIQPIESGRKY